MRLRCSILKAPRAAYALPLVVATVVATGACGGERAAEEGAPADSARFALLTSGPVSDAGWYAGGYEGLLLLRDSLGAAVSHQQTRTPAEFDEAFRAYGNAGYDIVFAHGFEYQDAAIRAGEQFPEMFIVVSGGGRVAENVVPVVFTLEQGSYLAGMAAAGFTKSGVLGMVGGMAIPSVQGVFRAFEAGAKAVRPDVRVLETFIGSWDDVSAAKEAAVAQLRQGADVLVHNTDAASFGVFQAAREATTAGDSAWVIGMNGDQNEIAPEVTLGSAVLRLPRAFLEVAEVWRAGQLVGKPVYSGMSKGTVDYVPNPAVVGRYPEGLLQRIDEARRAILSGALEVPRVPYVEGEVGPPPEAGAAETGAPAGG
jgi:basic membrane lipoprotein Med (substrate-binding protein (PBP1-ABC) superfamily)